VGARTLGLHYQVSDEFSWGEMGANLEYLNNIGGGPGNGAANYTANGAVRMWDAWRAGVSASTQAGGWQLTGRVKGQYASKALIVGEQFGLGGANSVRGFSDRAVTGDYGSQWNLEATGPAMSSYEIHPVVFVEGGRVRSRATGVTESIAGAGAGLRISNRKVQVSLDLAQVIDRNRAETSNPLRLHFSLTYRF